MSANAAGLDYGGTLISLRGAIAAQTASLPVAATGASLISVGIKVAVGVVLAGGIAVWATRNAGDETDARGIAAARLGPVDAESRAERAEQQDPPRDPHGGVTSERGQVTPLSGGSVGLTPSRDTADEIEILDAPPSEAGTSDDGRSDRNRARRRDDGGDVANDAHPAGSGAASPDGTPVTDAGTGALAGGDVDRYVHEAKLVAEARRALAGDPSRSLEITGELEREFPNGVLEEERRALTIRALTQLGRDDEARVAAKSFLVKFPDGPHAAAVRRAIDRSDTSP
ncbi:MAG: hypothetical protein IAG13_33980 [Deltaproteobacteria bacterium]|nr:hypothetical protein [Nannocystaceae bacterium]